LENEIELIKTCAHLLSTCTECLREHLKARFDDRHIDQITCPDLKCKELWTIDHVRGFATVAQLNTFRQRKREADPNFRRCLNPECDAGKVYGDGGTHPRITCEECGFAMCFTHRMPWHKRQSCAGHDKKERRRLHHEEEKTAKKVKACPRCNVDLEKDGGCDHITCMYIFCLSLTYLPCFGACFGGG